MPRRVALSPDAIRHLEDIEAYIGGAASLPVAIRFVDGLIERCQALSDLSFRGTPRDDLRPGLRTTVYRRRVTIAYRVDAEVVTVLAVFYAGRDFEAALRADPED